MGISDTKTPIVEVSEVQVSFGGVTRLSAQHLAVGRGEIICIMGPSGSGKSLLLKSIAGLLKLNSGQIRIFGRELSTLSVAELAQRNAKIGMLFQRNALFDSMTVLENVCFPQTETLGVSQQKAEVRALELLESVGLRAAAERFPSEISGGMQKRLGIARALALNPELLLYDDPTAGLDPITSRNIMQMIRELQRQTLATALVVTNEVARARQIADRVVFLFKGELIDAGTPAQMESHGDLRVQQFVRGQVKGPLTEPGLQ